MRSDNSRDLSGIDITARSVARANFLLESNPDIVRQRAIQYIQQTQEGLSEGYDPVLLNCEMHLRRKMGQLKDTIEQPVYVRRR
jgi:hypothetical protein